MSNFDQRWQTLAQQARQAPEEAPQVPWGMATRVAARVREASAETWEDIFIRFGLRALWAALVLFGVSTALVWSDWSQFQMEVPPVEVSLSSHLLWP